MLVRGPKSGFRRTILFRRSLRRSPTIAESIFWSKVANKQFLNLKFRKQHGVGSYIVDFYCPEKKLVIEIDGDTHAADKDIENDRARGQYINSLGYSIIRYNNKDIINNIEGVFEDLRRKVGLL